jgi:group II intron reverse transcriptase/maturase
MRQKTGEQLELALEARGEAPHGQRSGEAPKTSRGDDRSGGDHALMERVVERVNALAALKRVKQNKGSPGVDGMRVGELGPYLVTHWEVIREQLLAGTYQPQPVRQAQIPKPGGDTRQLGIPTVLDRFIQQCLLQVLSPLYDPTFSEHSYGFRPKRSAHDAVRAARGYIQSGRRWVADVDLAKFFDRVNHDVLMERLSRRIADGRVLGLIRRYLVAGIMANGITSERTEGTPQGGPLSPLLANALLDEVDKALEKRGLVFARYADDLNVYAGSKRAADDAMATLKRLFARIRLQVNESKSAVARARERTFLGYSFYVAAGRVIRYRVASTALAEMKARVRVLTSRTGGQSLERVAQDLRSYLVGWKNYFQLAETPRVFRDLDEWIRRRVRAVQLKQWKQGPTICGELLARGASGPVARAVAAHASRWWAMAAHGGTQTALPTSHFDRLGIPRLAGR